MKCPSCNSDKVTSTWVTHTFMYRDVELTAKVPIRGCHCGEKWFDHVKEKIIEEIVAIHLSPVDVTTNEWEIAAKAAIKRADGYGSCIEPFLLMKTYKIPIEEMDEWCDQARDDYPCLFLARLIGTP